MFSFLKAEMWPTWLTWKPWYLPRPSNKVHASRWEGQIFHCHQVDLSGRWSIDCFTPCGGCQYWITLGWCGEKAVHRLTYVEYRELVDLHLWSGQPNPNPEFMKIGSGFIVAAQVCTANKYGWKKVSSTLFNQDIWDLLIPHNVWDSCMLHTCSHIHKRIELQGIAASSLNHIEEDWLPAKNSQWPAAKNQEIMPATISYYGPSTELYSLTLGWTNRGANGSAVW